MSSYSLLARVKYNLKRHASMIAMVVVGLLMGQIAADDVWFRNIIQLAVGKLINIGIGVSMSLIVLKWGFPKFHIQETIKDDPIAMAIVVGLVFVAIALQF
ncbi:MAG: hypothetical protein V1799_07385 [bacterium]